MCNTKTQHSYGPNIRRANYVFVLARIPKYSSHMSAGTLLFKKEKDSVQRSFQRIRISIQRSNHVTRPIHQHCSLHNFLYVILNCAVSHPAATRRVRVKSVSLKNAVAPPPRMKPGVKPFFVVGGVPKLRRTAFHLFLNEEADIGQSLQAFGTSLKTK